MLCLAYSIQLLQDFSRGTKVVHTHIYLETVISSISFKVLIKNEKTSNPLELHYITGRYKSDVIFSSLQCSRVLSGHSRVGVHNDPDHSVHCQREREGSLREVKNRHMVKSTCWLCGVQTHSMCICVSVDSEAIIDLRGEQLIHLIQKILSLLAWLEF